MVRKIGGYRRIEVTIGVKPIPGEGEGVTGFAIGDSEGGSYRSKGSPVHIQLSVPSRTLLLFRVYLDNATEFPSIFSGISRGDYTQRFHAIGIECGSECR